MKKLTAKKYLDALKAIPLKCVTSDKLSSEMGIYPDIIAKDLSFFEPLVGLDTTYNLKDLIPHLEKYLKKLATSKPKKKKKKVTKKKEEKLPYSSIADFVYQKMTFDGLLNRTMILSAEELKILRKLISQERLIGTEKGVKK